MKKGNPFEEGGGEDKQAKGLGRTRTDEDKDMTRRGGEDKGGLQGNG